jgi:hypothetical protein
MILGVFRALGSELPLGVVGLAAELMPKVSAQGTGPDWKEPVPVVGRISWAPAQTGTEHFYFYSFILFKIMSFVSFP